MEVPPWGAAREGECNYTPWSETERTVITA